MEQDKQKEQQKQVQLDSVVTAIIDKFKQRAEFGQAKYGTNLDRTDLSILDWIQHAQEEHMDAILYLEKLKQEYKKANPESNPETSQNTSQTTNIVSSLTQQLNDFHWRV